MTKMPFCKGFSAIQFCGSKHQNHMPKSTKRFVISDSSLNEYGFRILTSGVDIKQFKKNPIMLWMHFRAWRGNKDEVLPLGYWDDIKIEEDHITAVPVFDDKDAFAMQIFEKVEAGILRMCSGGFKVKVWSEDPADLVSGQTRPTATKSILKEASICDLGANSNALALYDDNDEVINLNEASGIEKIPLLNNDPNMVKIELTVAVQQLLNLNDNSDNNAINSAIEAVFAENATLKTDKATLETDKANLSAQVATIKKASHDAKLNALCDDAISKGKITAAQKSFYVEMAGDNLDSLEKLFDSIPEHKTLSSQQNTSANNAELLELAKLSYDELSQQDKLERLMELDMPTFQLKHKERWGKEYDKK